MHKGPLWLWSRMLEGSLTQQMCGCWNQDRDKPLRPHLGVWVCEWGWAGLPHNRNSTQTMCSVWEDRKKSVWNITKETQIHYLCQSTKDSWVCDWLKMTKTESMRLMMLMKQGRRKKRVDTFFYALTRTRHLPSQQQGRLPLLFLPSVGFCRQRRNNKGFLVFPLKGFGCHKLILQISRFVFLLPHPWHAVCFNMQYTVVRVCSDARTNVWPQDFESMF